MKKTQLCRRYSEGVVEVVLEAEEVVDSLEGNSRSYRASAREDKIHGRDFSVHFF